MNALNKPLITLIALGLFAWLAVYAYHRAHPDADHGYSRQTHTDMSRLMDKAMPTNLAVYLFADDGQPVDLRIRLDEARRARKDRGH